MKTALAIGTAYLIFNIYVTIRINKSYYLSEERRKLHKIIIWLVPFIGPLILVNFWTRKKIKMDTMTKVEREKKKGDFYESGIGLNS